MNQENKSKSKEVIKILSKFNLLNSMDGIALANASMNEDGKFTNDELKNLKLSDYWPKKNERCEVRKRFQKAVESNKFLMAARLMCAIDRKNMLQLYKTQYNYALDLVNN